MSNELVREHIISCWKVGRRLNWSLARIAPLFPMNAAAIATLSDEDQEQIDAFLLRFSNMVTIIQDSLFKGVLTLEGEDPQNKSARDKTNLMEKLGAIPSAAQFSPLALLRNKLSHSYPDDPQKQAELISMAWKLGQEVIVVFNWIIRYVRKKNLIVGLEDYTIKVDFSGPEDDPCAS